MLKNFFRSLLNRFDRYTDWKLVQWNVPGKVIVNGKTDFRSVDTYERYDKVTKMFEKKMIYNEPTKVIVGIKDSLSSSCYFNTRNKK